MDLLLDQSTLIQCFSGEELLDVRGRCRHKFENIYNDFTSTPNPDRDLVQKAIDMYLYLCAPPSEKLLTILKENLLEGITFNHLDIYTHLPEYEQIVKLLRPEYYVKINQKIFRIFTINKTIYDIASKTYNIKDDFKHAYSTWYIQYLESKGMTMHTSDMHYYLTYGPWVCAKYAMKKLYTNDEKTLQFVLKGGMKEALDYVLYRGANRNTIANMAVACNRYDLMPKEPVFINEIYIKEALAVRNYKMAMHVLTNHRYNELDFLQICIIFRWYDGVARLLDAPYTSEYINNAIILGDMSIIELLYKNGIARGINPYVSLVFASKTHDLEIFKLLLQISGCVMQRSIYMESVSTTVLEYCINNGYKYSKKNIIRAMHKNVDISVIKVMLKHKPYTAQYAKAAVQYDRWDVLQHLRTIGRVVDYKRYL